MPAGEMLKEIPGVDTGFRKRVGASNFGRKTAGGIQGALQALQVGSGEKPQKLLLFGPLPVQE